MESRWLSVVEIAHYLGVVEETVYRWTRRWVKSGKATEKTKIAR